MSGGFLFLGGDLRSLYAAKKLSEIYKVSAYGFEEAETPFDLNLLDNLNGKKFETVVLPLPASADNIHITAPYSKRKIPFTLISKVVKKGGTVMVGRKWRELEEYCNHNNLVLIDYFQREELVIMNAMLTAEGTLQLAMKERASSIFGSKVLLTGFGRISKILLKYLTAMGADVVVTARSYEQLAWVEIMGGEAVHLNHILPLLNTFDLVINTVPATVFNEEKLTSLKEDCLFIDVASKSSIEDFELAKNLGVKTIWALSIPGKVAPITAGEFIAQTILNIQRERGDIHVYD